MKIDETFRKVRNEGRNVLTVLESKDVLRDFGLPINKTILARDDSEFEKAISYVGFPCVMKIVSPEIIHKTDVGGVVVGLQNIEKVKSAYSEIMAKVEQKYPNAHIDGVVLEQQIDEGIELIIGTVNDPTFGDVLMFGLGGIFVEVLKDVAFRLIPLNRQDAESIITDIKAAKVLSGVRGRPPVDKESLIELILKVSDFVYKYPIEELDLNPVIASAKGVSVVDARIILKKTNK